MRRIRPPPKHIPLLRQLCVAERNQLSATEFEDRIAATNLLPGPTSANFCAWRLRRVSGAVVGALCSIVPGLVLILGLAALFLSGTPARPERERRWPRTLPSD